MKHLEESNKKMADTASEAGATTPGATDTDGNYRTDETDDPDDDVDDDEDGDAEQEASVYQVPVSC